jgi:undecaprenyl-diphosphatase
MVQTNTGLAKWDLSFARWGAEHATELSTRVMRDVSLLGGTLGVLTIAVVVGIIEYHRRPNRAIPALLALTVLGQFVIVNIIKVVVNRDRPAISQLTGFSSQSFPSGHAAAAAATFAVLGLLMGRGRSRTTRNVIAGVAVGLAVLVASSRVMLGVHWLTDVVAGIALGWAWLAVCSIAFGGRLLQFGTPVAAAEAVAERTPAATGATTRDSNAPPLGTEHT